MRPRLGRRPEPEPDASFAVLGARTPTHDPARLHTPWNHPAQRPRQRLHKLRLAPAGSVGGWPPGELL